MTDTYADNSSDHTDEQFQVTSFDQNQSSVGYQRSVAFVTHCDSRRLTFEASVKPGSEEMSNHWAVGQQISVTVGDHRVIGQIEKVQINVGDWQTNAENRVSVYVELVGEITQTAKGSKFNTGISNFPKMGCDVQRVRSEDLAAIYENTGDQTIVVGHLTQDNTIEAKVDIEKLLSRHFAVVGSTGVGKSTAVCMMIRKIVAARKNLRVLLLDPHNEFASAFPKHAISINDKNLSLPFWLFAFDEIAEVIFRGQPDTDEEREILRDLIVDAKQRFLTGEENQLNRFRRQQSSKRINADTPVPYRIPDLLKLVDERLGLLENRASKPFLKRLQDRINSISNDSRYQFMFDPVNCGGDRLADVIAHIFRIPINDKPIAVVEMSGLPSEVVSSVVSVLCRLAFEISLSSQGGVETLVVCEEAHRYIPSDQNSGFWPVQQAIGRIAKEGRKYGTYLGIISQRPAELDQTILSQCNTIFALRLSNRKDQGIIAGAFTGGVQSTVDFLPSIANRECVIFGEAVYSPMRITFETIPDSDLPGSNLKDNQQEVRSGKQIGINTIITNLRRSGVGSLDQTASSDPSTQVREPLYQQGVNQVQHRKVVSKDEPEDFPVSEHEVFDTSGLPQPEHGSDNYETDTDSDGELQKRYRKLLSLS